MSYHRLRRRSLTRFIDDVRVEPDTNIAERRIRSIANGKRNSYFSPPSA
jgi:hypothetical protein